jgi:hypothetical protein
MHKNDDLLNGRMTCILYGALILSEHLKKFFETTSVLRTQCIILLYIFLPDSYLLFCIPICVCAEIGLTEEADVYGKIRTIVLTKNFKISRYALTEHE